MKKGSVLRIIIFAFACLNVLNYFFPYRPLFYLSMICLLYILAVSLFTLPKVSSLVILALFLCAAALMIYAHADLSQWMEGFGKNGLLVALFTCGPLLHLPFTYEDYQSELIHVARLYMHTMIPFNLLIALPTHVFAALTGFAAFAIIYNLFLNTSKLYDAEDIFIATLGRSYSTSGFWGTSWVSAMLVVSELHIPWLHLILIGILFTIVSIGVNLASIKIRMLRHPGKYPTLAADDTTSVDWRRIRMMAYLALSIVLITLIINRTTGWNLLAIVPLVSFVLPLAIAVLQKKTKVLKMGLITYFDKNLYKSRMEVCLFSVAGLLAYALDISGVGAMIPKLIPQVLIGHTYLFIIALMLLVILPGQLGIHPVAVGTTLIATIVPAAVGLSTYTFAITIICAWLLSNMLSPFSALNLTLAGLSGKSTLYTGLKLNWRYALVCIFLYAAIIVAMGPLWN